jgi:hypothetical protein
MIQRRFIALVVVLLVAVAGCVPAHAEEDSRAIRRGKHLSRGVEQALIVRCSPKDQTGQRRSASKVWSRQTDDSLVPAAVEIRILPVRTVDTLPRYWGALHLTI